MELQDAPDGVVPTFGMTGGSIVAPTALPGTSSTAFTSAAAARRAARREANLQKGKMPAKHERPATGSNPESEESEDAEDDEEEEEEPEEDNKSQGKLGAKGGVAKGGKGAKPKDPEVVDEKRVKRLMRNRVSAQQARERRKHYVGNLEERARQLELENEQLIEQVQTLRRESDMLRSILKATRLN